MAEIKTSKFKKCIVAILQKIGIFDAVFKLYETIRVWYRNGRYLVTGAPDRLPMPDPKLIFLVTGGNDIDWFLKSGKFGAESIRNALGKNGLEIEKFESILDFGCGCGRVIRYWKDLKATAVHGTDYNLKLVAWCKNNLKFAKFETNNLWPPLLYNNGKFDFVYALSVFTHMSEELQLSWIDELSRVIKPGGYLLITTQGERYCKRINKADQEKFRNGQLVVQSKH